MNLLYEVSDEKETEEDIRTLCDGLKLLRYDYLGGNGSRGYGRVSFFDLFATAVLGEIPDSLIAACNKLLSNVDTKDND